jgi:hypothetical protein
LEEQRLKLALDLLNRLNKSEDFKAFKDNIVNPTIESLENELASVEADKMPEVILRAKLKHLNTLKWFFNKVFQQL